MAIDFNKIKAALNRVSSSNNTRASLWKPTGKHVIRIVPYSHNKENPFTELKFHYGLGGKTYLSPDTYGHPDPVVELATKLKRSGDKSDYKQGKELEPKMRVYVPIIVRGEEAEGVRFWAFGKQVYQELLSIISDPDYGDITDLSAGHDIVVEYKDKKDTGKDFAETSIRAKPQKSPAFDPSNKSLLEKVKNQKNLSELFPEPTYEELQAALEKWLGSSGEADQPATNSETTSVDDSVDEVKPAVKTTAEKSKVSVSQQEIAKQFDDLFK